MANGDYGYFGKGDTGYAQYMTAFNRNFGGSPALARTVTAIWASRNITSPEFCTEKRAAAQGTGPCAAALYGM